MCVRKTRCAVYCLLLLSGRCPRDRALLRRPCRTGRKQVKGAAMKSPKDKNSRQRKSQSLSMIAVPTDTDGELYLGQNKCQLS